MGFVISVCVILLSIYFYYRYKNRRKFTLASKFPGPMALPIIGNMLSLYNNDPLEILERIKAFRKEYGPIYRIWVGTKLSIMISDPHVTDIILSNPTKNLAKNSLYDFLHPWLRDGLLLSKGSKWHSRRKIITPTFHFKILEQFVEIFDKHSSILVRKLKAHENGRVFDIYPYVNLMALDVVCETSMGTEIHAQTNIQSPYSKAVHEITKILTVRFSKVWMRSELLFSLFANDLKQKSDQHIKTMHDFTETIIKQRRFKLLKEESENVMNKDDDGISKKPLFLDMLLKSSVDGVTLSDRDIQEEVDTFMFEGHDTVSSGISFALYLLSRHKHIQDKLFDEIRDVLGTDKNRPITYRDLQNLKYMELVIKECLRLYPSVPFIGRAIDEDTVIDKYTTIPAGASVLINFFMMFRDTKNFQNPDKFIPERFEVNSEENFHTYSYIPFSAGSRNCIGQRFAILEMKSVLSKVLRHYELLAVGPDPIVVLEIVLRSINGVQMGLRQRQY